MAWLTKFIYLKITCKDIYYVMISDKKKNIVEAKLTKNCIIL